MDVNMNVSQLLTLARNRRNTKIANVKNATKTRPGLVVISFGPPLSLRRKR
jgi:hypothetical protein